jgi:HSP20 family molecular chaperone IbpA
MSICTTGHRHPHVAETDSEVTLEFELPFWIEEDDVQVDISSTQLSVTVRNELSFQRSYWRNRHVTSFMHILQLPMCAALQSDQARAQRRLSAQDCADIF